MKLVISLVIFASSLFSDSIEKKADSEILFMLRGGESQSALIDICKFEKDKRECLKNHGLKHDSIYTIVPEVKGDDIQLAMPSNSALVIAPNQRDYEAVLSLASEKIIIHPDLFWDFIEDQSDEEPNRENLRNFCLEYVVDRLYIALEDKLMIGSCLHIDGLEKISFKASGESMLSPFYTRIAQSDPEYDYYQYFNNITGENND